MKAVAVAGTILVTAPRCASWFGRICEAVLIFSFGRMREAMCICCFGSACDAMRWTPAVLAALFLAAAAGPASAARLAAGHTHSLWIKDDNTLWAWGDNFKGQLGDGTRVDRSSPVKIN